jgi:hypothetical protein
MTYRHAALVSRMPKPCPVCDTKRTDATAIAQHNVQAAATGCRRYLA